MEIALEQMTPSRAISKTPDLPSGDYFLKMSVRVMFMNRKALPASLK
jgi:hypothetical protein